MLMTCVGCVQSVGGARRVVIAVLGLVLCILAGRSACLGQVLVDDRWADGSRSESNRPAEAAVWVGREDDVAVANGVLSTKLGETSQKIWSYVADEPVTLAVGQKLTASVSFIPRGALAETSSRSFRLGLFHDPTDPRVESDVNNDGGGAGAPWTDAQGYAVQMLFTGGEYASTKPFDLGKRHNLEGPSLLGTSGDYVKMSGGTSTTLELDKEYRLTLEVSRASETQIDLTASLYAGEEELATWSVSDDGSWLGDAAVYDRFDMLFIRIADNTTTADQIDFTNFKVELTGTAKPAE